MNSVLRWLWIVAFMAPQAPVASYSTSFNLTENPISEGGVWSNTGVDWTKVQTENGYAHGTQPGTGAYTDSYAYLSGFTADHEAQAVVYHDSTKTTGTQEVEILLRWADSAKVARGYECNFSYSGGYAQIVRWNGPLSSFTYLSSVSLSRALVTGDVVKARVVGNVITMYFNGTQITQATDSTWTTGQPGMAFWRGNGGGPNTALGFSSYTATSLGVAAPVAPAITSQPAPKTITAGQTATFSVTATGTAPLTYQWKRSNDGGATWTNVGTSQPTYTTGAATTSDSGAEFRVVVSNSAGSVTSSAALLTVNPGGGGSLPGPWQDEDIGAPAVSGTASFSAGTFTIQGGGTDIWGTSDQFHFAHQSLSGDGEIIARVEGLGNTDPWAKAGVMIRETLDANSKVAFTAITPANGTSFQRRTTTGGSSVSTAGPMVTAPYWVRLVRSGNTFTSSVSPNGATWTVIGSETIAMAPGVFIGLAVTSHNNGVTTTASIESVKGSGGWDFAGWSGGGGSGGGGGGACGATGLELLFVFGFLGLVRRRSP